MAPSADHADFTDPHSQMATVVVVGAGPAGLMLAYVCITKILPWPY